MNMSANNPTEPAAEARPASFSPGDRVYTDTGREYRRGKIADFGLCPVEGIVQAVTDKGVHVSWQVLCRPDGSPYGRLPGQTFESVERADALELIEDWGDMPTEERTKK